MCASLIVDKRVAEYCVYLSLLVWSLSVEPTVVMSRPSTVVLENVEHARHLTKNQHATTALLELRQQLVHEHHLAAVLRQVPVGGVGRTGLGAVEQVRVVAALAQLHEDVVQAHLVATSGAVHHVDVLHQDLRVPGARRELPSEVPKKDLHKLL